MGVAIATLALLTGCDLNPDGPRAPASSNSAASADGRPAPGNSARRPVTKDSREIVNPE